MFLPSQLPTETDLIAWNKLELKYKMSLHPVAAVTNGNSVLPGIPSKKNVHSSKDAGSNNNHRNQNI